MRNVLVIFEHQKHIDSSAQKFIESLGVSVIVNRSSNILVTADTTYKLIGAGFPYVNSLEDKLDGVRFDDVMIHGDVVLTKNVEWYIRSRMKESKETNNFVKEFIEFEI